MCKKALFLFLFFSLSLAANAQYEDDALPRSQDSSRRENRRLPRINNQIVDRRYLGLEMMLTLNSLNFFAEVSPFAAYKILEPVHVGAGLHGSFLTTGTSTGNFSTTYYGGHAFGRLIIGQSFFIHGEIRALNGVVDFNTRSRKWVASPIFGVGFSNGEFMQSWVLLGYAPNVDFADINPFGHFVYRLGFRF